MTKTDFRQIERIIHEHSPTIAANMIYELIKQYQTTGVAFAISVIDDLHIGHASSDTSDRLLKGIKNHIRDRYKAATGTDPAPNYPVKVELTNYSNNSNSSTNTEDN